MPPEGSTLSLRAPHGKPLADERLRATVEATARAIAERMGLVITDLTTDPRSITITLRTGQVECLGFMLELRRLTNAWYRAKYDVGPLWGPDPDPEPPNSDDGPSS